ncbi:MAG: hypothetical protein VB817_10730 [Pirellulaceae bacterium]
MSCSSLKTAGWCVVITAMLLPGCLAPDIWQLANQGPGNVEQMGEDGFTGPRLANPMVIPVRDRELLWGQLVDTIDDYFRIASEQRVRLVGTVLTEGRIETAPQPAATSLEPWRSDSIPGYHLRHATYQSIRERATVRVIPVADGFKIDVAVYRELEDLDRPEFATVGGATLRHDGSLTRPGEEREERPIRLGWIPVGRNPALEQAILFQLQQRMAAPYEPMPTVAP